MDDKKEKARLRAKAWYEANKEKAKKYQEENKQRRAENKKKWVENNRERVYAENRERQKNDKDGAKRRNDRYRATEKGKLNKDASRNAYRKRCKQASLNKYDHKKILEIYKKCKELSILTGKIHHVDHIIPISHELVCGIHCSWNLQIITKEANLSKTNKFGVPCH